MNFWANVEWDFLKLSCENHYSKIEKRCRCLNMFNFHFCRLIEQLHVVNLHVVHPNNNIILCQVWETLSVPCSSCWVIGPTTICGICCCICNLLMQVTLVVAVDNLNKCKLRKPESRRIRYMWKGSWILWKISIQVSHWKEVSGNLQNLGKNIIKVWKDIILTYLVSLFWFYIL